MKRLTHILFALALFFAIPAQAQGADLTVTTIERDPFVRLDGDRLEGFSIELWREIADQNNWTYNFVIVDSFVELLRPVRKGETDLAIANISITADREEVMDFSNSIFRSGLQVMIPKNDTSLHLAGSLQDPILYVIILALMISLITCAHLLWCADRKKSDQIARTYGRGIIESTWWTLTLGGFGRNLPRSTAGRLSLLTWMLALTIGLTFFTATLSSNYTTHILGSRITSHEDLISKKVGTTKGSTSETFLRSKGIDSIPYDNIQTMFHDVSAGKIDAVIHDAPLLRYYAQNDGKDKVIVVGELFNADEYGIALPVGSELTEQIDESLLRIKENGSYDRIHSKWFGN